MRKRWLFILLAALLLLLVVSVAGADVSQTALGAWVIGSGGGRSEAGGLALQGTIGQAVVGRATSGSTELCAGFWCQPGDGDHEHAVYLPALMQ
jgi:hypothetical protein